MVLPSSATDTGLPTMSGFPDRTSFTVEPKEKPLPAILTETEPVSPPFDGDTADAVTCLHLPAPLAFTIS